MTRVIEYSVVSPAVLDSLISRLGVFCTWIDIDEDKFQFSVCSYGEGCPFPFLKIQSILDKYSKCA